MRCIILLCMLLLLASEAFSATVEWQDSDMTMEIISIEVQKIDDQHIFTLRETIRRMNSIVPLASFIVQHVVHTAAPGIHQYSYDITAADGRGWSQALFVPESGEGKMTFNISDQWKFSEFDPHRDIRDTIFAILKIYHLQKIEVTLP